MQSIQNFMSSSYLKKKIKKNPKIYENANFKKIEPLYCA